MRRLLLSLSLALAVAFVVLTLYIPRIARIEVSGNRHYSKAQISALAKVELGGPFLWVNRWRVKGLVDDPWIERARIIRYWPDTISIHVWERSPAVVMGAGTGAVTDTIADTGSGRYVMALDGTVLGDVNDLTLSHLNDLVALRGWGDDRSHEAFELIRLLEEYEPKMVSYSPGGFDIELRDGWLFTPTLEALKKHWSGFLSQQGKSVYVYPWGVSVAP